MHAAAYEQFCTEYIGTVIHGYTDITPTEQQISLSAHPDLLDHCHLGLKSAAAPPWQVQGLTVL